MTVVGVDPGLAETGYGVVEARGSQLRAIDGGVIETAAGKPLERRLVEIAAALRELLRSHQPQAVAFEQIYFGRNAVSALAVGHARGVALLAAGELGIACFAYTPQQIKEAVCGSGRAGKEQVARMVARLLALPQPPQPSHTADAFAAAICHANSAPLRSALAALEVGR